MTPVPPDLPTLDQFEALVAWRRDVRRFKTDPVSGTLLDRLLEVAHLAPSVGNSQPWRIVQVVSPALRANARDNFDVANANAADAYTGDQRASYDALKLAGFDADRVHLDIFCDPVPFEGHCIGRRTQHETIDHSCAGMIMVLWLAARAQGIGLGWVSILDTDALVGALDVPAGWRFIGYLLLGYPQEEHLDPELVRFGWQQRGSVAERRFVR